MKWFVAIIMGVFLVARPAAAEVFITVDISEQVMMVEAPDFQDSYLIWDVSTGKKGNITPTGNYKPYMLKEMHYSKKYDDAPMPYSIFYDGGYAIHGTNAIGKLGSKASHGCIRLHPENAKFLYELVNYYGKNSTHIEIVP